MSTRAPSAPSPTRTVIVTGANMGLGFQCARTLAASSSSSWHVVLAGRDLAGSRLAAARIAEETGNPRVEALVLDLASLASVRAFAASWSDVPRPPLGALVLNAGIQVVNGLSKTVDGIETTFGTNHLGHFLFVHAMLPHLVAPARIVVVASGTHDPDTIDGRFNAPIYRDAKSLAWPEGSGVPRMSGIRRYATSKLCNVLFTYELDRRLRAAGSSPHEIAVNAYDPGATPGTGLVRQYPRFVQVMWRSAFVRRVLQLLGLRVYTPERSGAAMARLVLDPALAGVSGRYFHVDEETRSSKESHDRDKAKELWESSEEIAGLDARERHAIARTLPFTSSSPL